MVFRMTVQTQLVLQALLHAPGRELYGLELADETGLLPGTAYPILARLENEGWVSSRWEDIDPAAEKRPARRYYRLTAAGTAQAGAAVTAARRPARAALRRLADEGGHA
jgi:PadR family transcriptional regulator PadR